MDKFAIIKRRWKTAIVYGFIMIIVLSFLIGIQLTNDNVLDKNPEKTIMVSFGFELPIEGSSGYAPTIINLKKENKLNSETITTIEPGEAFRIILEDANWWQINYKGLIGWVENTICMINLPDIIPSIIYNNTNSYSSMFKSSGYDIDYITGSQLYNAYMYNNRFEKEQYIMPVMYPMAKKIYTVQKLALENDESLMIYETFRPYDVQTNIANALLALLDYNTDVQEGIFVSGWNINWFIATGVSGHQMGLSMDVSLVKINEYITKIIGKDKYMEITSYTPYPMPTDMHELSIKAARFKYGVSGLTAWKKTPFAITMTEEAKKLQNYCTSANLIPLASEWWHFDDLETKSTIARLGYKNLQGKFYLEENVSEKFSEVKEVN